MKKLTFVAAMLLGTAAFAQTAAIPQDDIKTYVNDQITDAVTQLDNKIKDHKSELQTNFETLEKQVVALQSVVDELTRKDNISHSRAFFHFDGYVATAESNALIDEVAKFMKDYPAYVVTIEGHADERGTREYNLYLGEKRASMLKESLVSKGIDANRIQTVSYGKERPAVLGSNEAAWSQNRRGVFVLNK
jgi:peptidoglycan-associated lipoprotein